MSDERLIEEAAKAIIEVEYPEIAFGLLSERRREFRREQARAALAVFEKAHTPIDDEVDAEAERIWPIGRDYFPHQTRAVFSVKELDAYCASAFKRGAQWAAGFRRAEVPEPSAEDHMPKVIDYLTRTNIHVAAPLSDAMRPVLGIVEPQGEPSDARKISEAISRASVRGVEFMDQGEGPGGARD